MRSKVPSYLTWQLLALSEDRGLSDYPQTSLELNACRRSLIFISREKPKDIMSAVLIWDNIAFTVGSGTTPYDENIDPVPQKG